MVDFPKYESYKDSGVEWLGEIPSSWEVKRLKFLGNIKTGEKDTVNSVDDGEYPFFVRSQTVERIDTYSHDEEAVLTAGDGVGVGKVFHYINGKFDYHQRVYKVSKFREILGKYLFYYMKSFLYEEVIKLSAKSTVDSLRLPMFLNFPIICGEIEVQQRIVKFLDRKTAEIDQAIAQKQRLIELLQEQKAILINQAVTKGLDPNVPMCDSRINWIGEIPSNWILKAIKHISFVNPSGNRAQKEEQVTFLPMEAVLANGQYDVSRVDIRKAFPASLTEFNQGDVLLAKITPCFENGKSAFLEELPTQKGIGSTEFHVFRVDKKQLTPKFLYYAIYNEAFRTYAQAFMEGTAGQKRITTPFISNTKIPVPSIEEQNRIVKFIERQTSETDQAIAHEQRFIKLLQEQKTIFISQAIAGKLKV